MHFSNKYLTSCTYFFQIGNGLLLYKGLVSIRWRIYAAMLLDTSYKVGCRYNSMTPVSGLYGNPYTNKQRVLMHGHQGWNVRHGLCHIHMIYVYIWVVYSFCLFCCLFIIVSTQFVALYKPCKPKLKPSTYDPPDNHPLAEIQRPILRPEPKQQICHQHANTDHFGK